MNREQHWLERPRTIYWLWRGGFAVLALTVLADLFYEPHPYFVVDGLFGFFAAYGFLTCVAMVLFAKLLAVFLKRADTYYDDPEDDETRGA
jgi:hypothetical protein